MASRNRGKPKPKLITLSREQLSSEEFNASLAAFTSSPPIVAAIIGAGLVEHKLDELLRVRFARKDDDTWVALTSENGPLSTFAAKIIAGYALGIYDKSLQKNLGVVRNIRNAFAHTKRLIDFDHPLVIIEIQKIEVPGKGKRGLAGSLASARSLKHSGWGSYIILCASLISALVARSATRVQARTRYLNQKEARMKAANPSLWALAELLSNQKELPAGFGGGFQLPRSGDPTAPILGRGLLSDVLSSQVDRNMGKPK